LRDADCAIEDEDDKDDDDDDDDDDDIFSAFPYMVGTSLRPLPNDVRVRAPCSNT
jgi:hypothetical protein